MSDIRIQIPEPLKSYLDGEVARRGYKDASEFVQNLIEADQHRQLKQEIEGMLQEAADGPFSDWTNDDMEDIRSIGGRLIKGRQAK